MRIPVCGFDPSLTHWGIAEGMLDLELGHLDDLVLSIAFTEKTSQKQLRVNSDDLGRCQELASFVLPAARRAKVIFVEIPVGSQSAAAMKSYGVCLGILGVLQNQGHQLIQVDAKSVKKALSGNPLATKATMIAEGMAAYPTANWPLQTKNGKLFKKGDVKNEAEHMADAIGAIHAGVLTPEFVNVMRILKSV